MIFGGEIILNKIIFYLLLALLVITPLPYGTVDMWSTGIWELLILGLTLLWGIQALVQKKFEIVVSPIVWPMLGLVTIAIIQLIPFSSGPKQTITYDSFATKDAAVKVVILILFVLLFGSVVNSDERRQRIVTTVVMVCAAIALIGIGQSYLGKVIWPRADAGYGPFINRNHFAGFLEVGIGLAGARVVGRSIQREKLVLYICYLIVMITGLILCASRGGFLALGGIALFLALTYVPAQTASPEQKDAKGKTQFRLIGALVLLVFLAFGAMYLTSSDELMQRFSMVKEDMKTGELADERFSRRELWGTTLKIIKDHPIFGAGLGAYQYVYTRYDQSSGLYRTEQSHNDYLQILVDTGILGGIAAAAFLVILFIRGFSGLQTRNLARRAITTGALAGCFGIAVHSFVDFNLQVTVNAQLFLVLATLATTRPLNPAAKIEKEEIYRELPHHLLRS